MGDAVFQVFFDGFVYESCCFTLGKYPANLSKKKLFLFCDYFIAIVIAFDARMPIE
jgi:hypothetical protein